MAEVRGLAEAGLRGRRTASRALGYAQVLRFLDGEWSQEQAAAQTVRATPRFARRQESWFRRDPRITWLDGADLAADDGAGLAVPGPGYDQVMRFAKGHGTGNDFLILPDPDDAVVLSPGLVARLCDRRTGLGADGILRVVRRTRAAGCGPGRPSGSWTTATPTAASPRCAATGSGCSPATCSATAWPTGPEFAVATRAGLRLVRAEASGEIHRGHGRPGRRRSAPPR